MSGRRVIRQGGRATGREGRCAKAARDFCARFGGTAAALSWEMDSLGGGGGAVSVLAALMCHGGLAASLDGTATEACPRAID